jgi:hypothetical protein
MQNRLEKVENASNELTKGVKSIERRTVKKRTTGHHVIEASLLYRTSAVVPVSVSIRQLKYSDGQTRTGECSKWLTPE